MSNVTNILDFRRGAREERRHDEAALEEIFARMGFRMAVVSYVDKNGISGSVDFMNVSRVQSQSKV